MPRAKRPASAHELQRAVEQLREREREERRELKERRTRERRELQERHRAALAVENAKRGAAVYALLAGPDGPAVSAFLLPRVPDHARALFQVAAPATPSPAEASGETHTEGTTGATKAAVGNGGPERDLWDGPA